MEGLLLVLLLLVFLLIVLPPVLLWRRLRQLERRLTWLESDRLQGAAVVAPVAEPPAAPAAAPEPPPVSAPPPPGQDIPEPESADLPVIDDFDFTVVDTPPPATSTAPDLWQRFWAWLAGGNPVLRSGMVILLLGVGFLLKYAAEHSLLSPELRLGSAGLLGLALLATGLGLRRRSETVAMVLQGGAIGILYLCVFAAFRLLGLLPVLPAFGLLLALVILSLTLALWQDAVALALFGALGGFLAPVLISTGTGSHVALFSYYLLLNLGILAVAVRRSWRSLNLLGVVCTFGIGAVWGYRYYQWFYFPSVEPFLLGFAVLYTVIAILFARRPLQGRAGLVDSALVFGVPLAAFVLQTGLVEMFDRGTAWSALGFGVYYGLLAVGVERSGKMPLLARSFLILAVGFVTLAVPLWLDARWTASTWAVEGAGMLWLGLHQRRWLSRLAGVVLQLLAGLSFLTALPVPPGPLPLANGVFLGALVLALAGLVSSYLLDPAREAELPVWETHLGWVCGVWGLGWWGFAAGSEIVRHLSPPQILAAELLVAGLTTTALLLAQRSLRWRLPLWAPLALLPLLAIELLYAWHWYLVRPLQGWGVVAWPLAFAAHLQALRQCGPLWPPRVRRQAHAAWVWLAALVLAWELDAWLGRWFLFRAPWEWLAWGLLPVVVGLALHTRPLRHRWPLAADPEAYLGWGQAPLLGGALFWSLAACTQPAQPEPLPYLPLLNPVELVQLAALLLYALWGARQPRSWRPALLWSGAAYTFVLLNTVVARSVHAFAGVPWRFHRMADSLVFQASLSLTWGAVALVTMVLAHRRRLRPVWFAGAALLGLEVAKLMLVDLAGHGTLARIISFVGVGLLMLVIGAFAPLPPAQEK